MQNIKINVLETLRFTFIHNFFIVIYPQKIENQIQSGSEE